MSERKKVYIAGPMRGLPQFNFPAFYKAEAMLDLWGLDALNPARMDIKDNKATFNHNMNRSSGGDVIAENTFTIEDAFTRDFQAIIAADAVMVLPGWKQSQGANREVAFSTSIGKPVYLYDEEKPLNLDTSEPLEIQIDLQCYEAGQPQPGKGIPVSDV